MFNFNSMSDDELCELINAANKEQDERRKMGKEKAWRKLKNALNEYLEWDDIAVDGFGDKVFINKSGFNAENVGIIRLDY